MQENLIKSDQISFILIQLNINQWPCTPLFLCSLLFTIVAIVITCNTSHQWLQLTANTLKVITIVVRWNNGEQREIMFLQENFTQLN